MAFDEDECAWWLSDSWLRLLYDPLDERGSWDEGIEDVEFRDEDGATTAAAWEDDVANDVERVEE